MGRAKNIPGKALLLPYQAKWVKDMSRLKIAEKSRQIGWTWATGYGLVSRKALKTARLDALRELQTESEELGLYK
jgi:phage FluMu gp28-like protein